MYGRNGVLFRQELPHTEGLKSHHAVGKPSAAVPL